MIQFLTTVVFVILIAAPGAYGRSINDLRLLGEGEAYYLRFIKVYDAALYAEPEVDPQDILDTQVSKCLLLDYKVPVGKKDFVKAANTILSRQFTEDELARVQPEIKRIHDGYTDVKSGDNYSLCYNGQTGVTTLRHNGIEVVRVSSKDFARVYFSIWLGNEKPLDHKLRDNLLATSR